jgi:hypothetical protein
MAFGSNETTPPMEEIVPIFHSFLQHLNVDRVLALYPHALQGPMAGRYLFVIGTRRESEGQATADH